MTYTEIELVGLSGADLYQAAKALNLIASHNLDGAAVSATFRNVLDRIVLADGIWGTTYPREEDLATLHKQYPVAMVVTEVGAIRTTGNVADLRNYMRIAYDAGQVTHIWRPAPITWVEA